MTVTPKSKFLPSFLPSFFLSTMVQLPIRAGELHGDWVLIDLQGSFESNVSELKGLTMGELSFTESVLLAIF